ncbi:hypothetical protein A5637_13275 [Mycolicibacterium fortuitum]|uniref:hypothetical protein n=1 Tax=Mycolicibacterium fortuitum TaxID=1766 RepID=UPI0007EDDFA2|nr:hypothetical protein [Mycolicibacterium fortuitum]OBK04047.1 hypothetical protein A5637_13275 [Mycolicibacterium fortuitum]
MGDNIAHLPDSDVAIRALHAEIERLAATASTAYISRTPVRVGANGIGDEMTFWYDGEHVKVFTCDGTVFMSGIEHGGYWPDWYCLARGEAREIANALWSASAYVDQEAKH